MSGRSARNYMTDAQLAEDARYWRREETQCKLRARSELRGDMWIVKAQWARQRAEASESFLRRRQLDAEQVSRSGVP